MQSVASTSASVLASVEDRSAVLSQQVAPTSVGHIATSQQDAVLLSTASIVIIGPSTSRVTRALLDTDSQITLVRESVVHLLRIPRRRQDVLLTDFQGQSGPTPRYCIDLRFSSWSGEHLYHAPPHVVSTLSSAMPSQEIRLPAWEHLRGLELADPNFAEPERIDVILGADICSQLFLGSSIPGPPGTPIALATKLGHVLPGPAGVPARVKRRLIASTQSGDDEIATDILTRFWKIEELPASVHVSPDDQACEQNFLSTHSRNSSGRYVVKLPFRRPPDVLLLGSRPAAARMLAAMETKMARNPNFGDRYRAFMQEILDLGHAFLWPQEFGEPSYYIPHHAVFLPEDLFRKLAELTTLCWAQTSG